MQQNTKRLNKKGNKDKDRDGERESVVMSIEKERYRWRWSCARLHMQSRAADLR